MNDTNRTHSTNAIVKKLAALACAIALACAALAGCANNASTSATAEQQANRAYMSQVNEIMEELGGGLDSFVDAVSRNDIVNMRTQADNAFKVLNTLVELEAPEALADVQKKYTEGVEKLQSALEGYINLYADMSAGSLDQAAYEDRVAQVQALYDEGVKLLEEGDQLAADKS